MDPTTLMTFLFKAQPEISTVELLGSWDNFQQPYRMHHDRRRGDGFYSGCFAFENIIFDGDVELQRSKPRSGGLKQGGTYWYYYRLNYDFEAFDDRQPHTTGCPLLPGQEVNIVNVPIEVLDLPSRCHSMYGNLIGTLAEYGTEQTLDPANKFASLLPPPASRVHVRCLSDDALSGRLERQIHVLKDERYSPVSPATSSHDRPLSRQKENTAPFETSTEVEELPISSGPHPQLDEAHEHTENTAVPTIDPYTFDDDDQLPKSPNPGLHELQQHSRFTFTESIHSGRPMILPTLNENDVPDEIPHQLAGRESGDFTFAFHDNYLRTSTSDDSNASPTNDVTIHVSRPLSEPSYHTPQKSFNHRLNLDNPFSSDPSSPISQSSIPSPQESDHPTPDYEPPEFPLLSSSTTAVVNDETLQNISARLHAISNSRNGNGSSSIDSIETFQEPPILPTLDLPILFPSENNRSRRDFWTTTTHYSLPSAATDSNHSLAKTVSAAQSRGAATTATNTMTTATNENMSAPRLELSIPGARVSAGNRSGEGSCFFEEPSIAEAIWSELGYLGESIA